MYLLNIKGKNEDDFNLASANGYNSVNENPSINQRATHTAVPSLRHSPIKGQSGKAINFVQQELQIIA
jgi:hypothetical protein